MYRDLEHKSLTVVDRLEGVQDGGKLGGVELDCAKASIHHVSHIGELHERFQWRLLTIDDGTDDLRVVLVSYLR